MVSVKEISIWILCLLSSWDVYSVEQAAELSIDLPYKSCFESAAKEYGVDAILLAAIAQKESDFVVSANNKSNKNGTEDVGIMQINSIWFRKLEARGITREILLTDACTNIRVGAWILAISFYENGVSWDSVGVYNAGASRNFNKAVIRYNYSTDVYKRYMDLRREAAEKEGMLAKN